MIIDTAIPGNAREAEMVEKYQEPSRELGRLWNFKTIEVSVSDWGI